MIKKTAISLKDDIYRDGIDKANRLFSGNFSAYVGYLICRDREEIPKETKQEGNKFTSALDDILNI